MIHVHDIAPASHDPTGTTMLRRRFVADARKRWTALDALTRAAIINAGMLGAPTVQSIGMAASAPRGDVFAHWFAEAMRQTVMDGNGAWTGPYIRQAADMAQRRARGLVETDGVYMAPLTTGGLYMPGYTPSLATLLSVTAAELQGITDAVAQQVARAIAHGQLARHKAPQLASAVSSIIKSTGIARTNAMINWYVVKAFAAVTLDVFRQQGVDRVGTVAERVPKPALDGLFDKARITPQKRHPRTGRFVKFARAPTRKERAEIERREKRLAGLGEINVENADDDLVCERCLKISEAGPYNIDDVLGLIPNHPHCRCVLIPVREDSGRFARRFAA